METHFGVPLIKLSALYKTSLNILLPKLIAVCESFFGYSIPADRFYALSTNCSARQRNPPLLETLQHRSPFISILAAQLMKLLWFEFHPRWQISCNLSAILHQAIFMAWRTEECIYIGMLEISTVLDINMKLIALALVDESDIYG